METYVFPAVFNWQDDQFLPYLWGMETDENVKKLKALQTFLPYLWGMETF